MMRVCLFKWEHPAGFHAMPTSLAEAMPIDAVMTAFFACLGAMKRLDDVQRGVAPHIAPDALHRGPLWLLFPRGTPGLPKLSSLLGVTIVWGCLWGGLCVGLLSLAFAARRALLGVVCMEGWTYIAVRAVWSTSEALLVSAGSYILWCARPPPHAPALVATARARARCQSAHGAVRARAGAPRRTTSTSARWWSARGCAARPTRRTRAAPPPSLASTR